MLTIGIKNMTDTEAWEVGATLVPFSNPVTIVPSVVLHIIDFFIRTVGKSLVHSE
jgi:hypothetical protein